MKTQAYFLNLTGVATAVALAFGTLGAPPALAQSLAPSSPPSNHPALTGLTFSCNDGQYPGANPSMLGDFIAYHTRLTAVDQALDPHGTQQTHTGNPGTRNPGT